VPLDPKGTTRLRGDVASLVRWPFPLKHKIAVGRQSPIDVRWPVRSPAGTSSCPAPLRLIAGPTLWRGAAVRSPREGHRVSSCSRYCSAREGRYRAFRRLQLRLSAFGHAFQLALVVAARVYPVYFPNSIIWEFVLRANQRRLALLLLAGTAATALTTLLVTEHKSSGVLRPTAIALGLLGIGLLLLAGRKGRRKRTRTTQP